MHYDKKNKSTRTNIYRLSVSLDKEFRLPSGGHPFSLERWTGLLEVQ